jgi:hypothetical protein
MEERRLDHYGDLTVLDQRLADDLTIDTTEPETLTLTLAGTSAKEATAFLDVLATTIATESTRQMRNRGGDAWAVVDGERTENGQVRYATVNRVPIRDERLKYAGMISGGFFAVMLLLVGVVYARLMKTKREFEDDDVLYAVEPVEPPNASGVDIPGT